MKNWKKNIDDVGFFSALINHFVKIYNADPERIYATGASNGGMMCYRLACELSGKIIAVAALIAN
jgi:polyhydroxybutyrate depolymerase